VTTGKKPIMNGEKPPRPPTSASGVVLFLERLPFRKSKRNLFADPGWLRPTLVPAGMPASSRKPPTPCPRKGAPRCVSILLSFFSAPGRLLPLEASVHPLKDAEASSISRPSSVDTTINLG
jgi:hypothetical protein